MSLIINDTQGDQTAADLIAKLANSMPRGCHLETVEGQEVALSTPLKELPNKLLIKNNTEQIVTQVLKTYEAISRFLTIDTFVSPETDKDSDQAVVIVFKKASAAVWANVCKHLLSIITLSSTHLAFHDPERLINYRDNAINLLHQLTIRIRKDDTLASELGHHFFYPEGTNLYELFNNASELKPLEVSIIINTLNFIDRYLALPEELEGDHHNLKQALGLFADDEDGVTTTTS